MRIRSIQPDNSVNSIAGTTRPVAEQITDVLDTVGFGFYILDKNFVMVHANKTFEKNTGIKRKNAVGKSIWRSFPHVAYGTSPFWTHFHEAMEKRKHVTFNYQNIHAIWVEVNVYPTKEGGIAVFIKNITDRIKTEEAVRESEARLRALLNDTADSVYVMSPDFSELTRIHGTGYPTDTDMADKNWVQKYITEEHQERVNLVVAEALEKKQSFALEHRVKTRHGNIVWMYSRATPIFDANGNLVEWFGASTDITERRKQLEAEERMRLLTEQRNALVKINKAKDEFVALASHQLRTPATAVKQYIAMLMNGFAGQVDEEKMRLLDAAYDSNERELKIINDLLQTAAIDGSSHNLKAVQCDIIELVSEVIKEMLPTLEHRNQSIKFQHDDRLIPLKADITHIKLAISNLVENASKYSPRGSLIKVDIHSDGVFANISVIDKGVGISEENKEKIFEKFSRVNNPLSDTVSGSGLGLYWVKRIAELHKGSVELKSKPGKGSTFTLLLPCQNSKN